MNNAFDGWSSVSRGLFAHIVPSCVDRTRIRYMSDSSIRLHNPRDIIYWGCDSPTLNIKSGDYKICTIRL